MTTRRGRLDLRRSLLAVALTGGIALGLGAPAPALAHAIPVGSDPPDLCGAPRAGSAARRGGGDCAHGEVLAAGPTTIRVWFDEPVRAFGDGIEVFGPDGRRVDRAPARSAGPVLLVGLDARTPGTYVVRWQVVSSDTHPATGRFAFSVGAPSANARAVVEPGLGAIDPVGLALQVLARWLHFVGLVLSLGVLSVIPLLDGPGGRVLAEATSAERGRATPRALLARAGAGSVSARPPDPGDPRADRYGGVAPLEASLLSLVGMGVLGLLLAEPLALLGQTASLGLDQVLDPALLADALGSDFGGQLGVRLGIALGLWVILGFAQAGWRPATPLALGGAALLPVVDGLASHAVSSQPAWFWLSVNAIHLVATSAWLGGIVAVLRVWQHVGVSGIRGRVVRVVGKRVALAVVAAMGSGVALAIQHVPNPADLTGTDYGRVVALKAIVVGSALAAALVARRKPGARWRGRRAEAGLLLAALGLAGLLVSLPPPR